jgi:translocation and assembly module TamB
MDLAAAFGPVEGSRTTVNFTDLLGLVTAPGQLAEIDRDPHRHRRVRRPHPLPAPPGLSGCGSRRRWPFAGGELSSRRRSSISASLRPSGSSSGRRPRCRALHPADGILQHHRHRHVRRRHPDGVRQRGGRIVGGRLVARPEGGTLSYIGELTDKQLGTYGKLAFDALKSLRYSKLIINLDGALEGEFVAGIELDGIARDPALTAPSGRAAASAGMVAAGRSASSPRSRSSSTSPSAGPFRALIATARSFEDPSNLIQSVLPRRASRPAHHRHRSA